MQQLIVVILANVAIDLCSWINNVNTGTTKRRYADWYHQTHWMLHGCAADGRMECLSSKFRMEHTDGRFGRLVGDATLNNFSSVNQIKLPTTPDNVSADADIVRGEPACCSRSTLRLYASSDIYGADLFLITVLRDATDIPTWRTISLWVLWVRGASSWLKVSCSICVPVWTTTTRLVSKGTRDVNLRISFFRPSRVHPLLGNILNNCFAM